jgi:hypothetical protein
MSFCPASGNTGFVHLAGPLQPSEISAITEKNYVPITLSFTTRTTIPTLLGTNEIIEEPTHQCIHKGRRYALESVQVCAPLHKGFQLPGENPRQAPAAECILSYVPSETTTDSTLSGILLCLPLYESGTPAYDTYLEQIVQDTEIACGYENVVGKRYEGDDKRTLSDTSLRQCVKACCDDAQCLAYTFGGGTCHIKHSIPNQLSTGDATVSGKIKRGQNQSACSASSSTSQGGLAVGLSSLFYQADGKTTHTAIGYPTCFESVMTDKKIHQNKVYVVVFPKGIRMRPTSYQQFVLRMNGTLPSYRVPSKLRNRGKTWLRYRMDNGVKVPVETSENGEVYTTTISTCTEEFRERFEYFVLPSLSASSVSSKAPSAISSSSASSASSTRISPRPEPSCKNLTTKQYKCVPFNEATDLEGNVVVPGRATLEETLKKQKEAAAKQASGGESSTGLNLSPGAIEAIVGGGIGGILLLYGVYRVATSIFNRPTE